MQNLSGQSLPGLLRQRVHKRVDKKEYYLGLKAALIVTPPGQPVELLLAPASTADITTLRNRDLNLPDSTTLLGDGGFLDREWESALRQEAGIELIVPRRKNRKAQLPGLLRERGMVDLSASDLPQAGGDDFEPTDPAFCPFDSCGDAAWFRVKDIRDRPCFQHPRVEWQQLGLEYDYADAEVKFSAFRVGTLYGRI